MLVFLNPDQEEECGDACQQEDSKECGEAILQVHAEEGDEFRDIGRGVKLQCMDNKMGGNEKTVYAKEDQERFVS